MSRAGDVGSASTTIKALDKAESKGAEQEVVTPVEFSLMKQLLGLKITPDDVKQNKGRE